MGADDATAEAVAGFEDEDEEAERRVRLLERVVGPDDDDEGAAEEASARFRLRVSIQEPQPPQFDYSARHRAAITPFRIRLCPASAADSIETQNDTKKKNPQLTTNKNPPIRNPRLLLFLSLFYSTANIEKFSQRKPRIRTRKTINKSEHCIFSENC